MIKSVFFRLLKITITEWSLFFKDPAAVLILVVAGILYSIYYPLPYLHEITEKVPAGVVDHDKTNMSRQLIRMSASMQQIDVTEVYENADEAQKDMAAAKIYGYLEIPQGMEAEVRKGNNVTLGVYTHGAYLMLYSNVATAFATSVATIGATVEVKRLAVKGYSAKQGMAIRDPLPTRFLTMFNGVGGYGAYVVPAVLMIVLQQTLLIGICTLGGPRRNRHFHSLRGKEISENEPLLFRYFGRSVAYLLHYLVFVIFYHTVVYWLFDFPKHGNVWVMLVFAMAFFGAVINMGMWISQFFSRRETGMQVLVCVAIPFLFMTGFSWPQESMPLWVQSFAYFLPSTYAVPCWIAIENMGANFLEVRHYIFHLYGLSIFYLALGLLLAKRDDLRKHFQELRKITTGSRLYCTVLKRFQR